MQKPHPHLSPHSSNLPPVSRTPDVHISGDTSQNYQQAHVPADTDYPPIGMPADRTGPAEEYTADTTDTLPVQPDSTTKAIGERLTAMASEPHPEESKPEHEGLSLPPTSDAKSSADNPAPSSGENLPLGHSKLAREFEKPEPPSAGKVSNETPDETGKDSPSPAAEPPIPPSGSSASREPSMDPPASPPSGSDGGRDRPPGPPDPPGESVVPSPDEGKPPINQVQDVLMGRRSMIEQPTDSYYELSNQLHERVRVAGENGVSAEMHEDLSQNLALRDMVRSSVFPLGTELAEAERDAEMTPYFDSSLQPHGTSMTSIQERAQQLSPKEVLDYFMDKLESHTTFLETGRPPDNWPEVVAPDRLVGAEVLGTVRSTAEVVRVSIDSLRDELGPGAAELTQRHQAWVDETASLLLSKGNVCQPHPFPTLSLNPWLPDRIA